MALEHTCHRAITPPPVPRYEGNIRREVVGSHKRQKTLIIQEPVLGPEQRIVQDNTGIVFWSSPACFSEGPFDVHDDWQCRRHMIPDVKIARGQLGIYIDDF